MVNSKLKFYIAILIFAFCIFNLMGCATYKFHHGQAPYNKGYVVSRDDYNILEYTLGKDNTVPKLPVAKERLKRRRDRVEDYYKRMGYIENHFRMVFWGPCIYFCKLAGGVFRLPFIAISDYRANRNPKYKEKLRKIEEEKEAREEARIAKLKERLNLYIQKDLTSEPPMPVEVAQEAPKPVKEEPAETKEPVKEEPIKQPVPAAKTEEKVAPAEQPSPAQEVKPQAQEAAQKPAAETPQPALVEKEAEVPAAQPAPVAEEVKAPVTQPAKEGFFQRTMKKFRPTKKAPAKEARSPESPRQPVAVIIAKPAKGISPLRVKFYGSKSYVPKGRIIAYSWDFGDSDTSTKANPTNTYYSGSFEPQYFNVTLTVQDDLGNAAKATATIEVLNK